MALYGIFSFLDYAIYSMVKYVVRLIILIANADFFKEDTIGEVASKVYVVLGVLVLFKIVISCIQYMVNPDTFDDKDKGMAGILKKAVISMALLAVVQPVFKFALEMQSTIVSTIPSIVLGNSSERVTIKDNNSQTFRDSLDKISDQVAGTTIWSFVTPKKNRNVTNGTTVDEFQQKITLGCDGSIWALFDTNKCDYEYRIGISTAAGIFLLYVLVSMTLDVGIRTIKFGILQILAPIPISSYIVSKDKLNKFVKLSTKVYLDLFVRLGVIYFIIFFIQKVIESIGDAGNIIASGAYKPEPLEQSFIKVVIIVALFMFAKNAPKFICEVLGIDGGGFGDMADMFKPAWQRAGGAAGAFINPARNAVSNWRDAWKNNADMVDNRGGKIRRAFQNARRVGNAARHGFGGAMKGAADALAGAAAGDDWAKMNERHRKAIATSKRRSAEGFMKRTDNDARQEVRDQRKAIENEFKEQGIDINKSMRELRSNAEQKVNQRIADNNNMINDLQHKIAEGVRTGSASQAQIATWQKELTAAKKLQGELSTKAGFDKAVNEEVKATRSAIAEKAVQAKVNSTNEKINANKQKMQDLQNLLADSTISASQRATAEASYVQLMNENNSLSNEITTEAQANLKAQYEKDIERQTQIKTEGLDRQRDISGGTIFKGKVDQFFGGEGFTGQGYTTVADTLKESRGSLWSGEAMAKLQQNPHILQIDGVENAYGANSSVVGYDVVEFEIDPSTGSPRVDPSTGKFKVKLDSSGNPVKRKYTYSEILDFKQQIATGQIKPGDIERVTGFKNATDLDAAFKDIEKSAASDYVTMAVEGHIANSTITESISRLKAKIASSNIPKEERNQLLEELEKNPGKFLKRASDIQEKMRTKGSRISAYNSGKKDS